MRLLLIEDDDILGRLLLPETAAGAGFVVELHLRTPELKAIPA